LTFDDLKRLRERHPQQKIVHCHGVFDVLHAGHLAYFESAKKFGDKLVVTVTSDEFVNKGPGRPYFSGSVRMDMLAALEVVDYVALSKFPTAVSVIECLRPDFYVKGPDYKEKAADVTGAIYAEERAVEAGGGKLVFTDDPTHSSSKLLNNFFNHWTDDQQRTIAAVKKAGGFSKIEEILQRLSDMKVTIVGEPIIDTYVFCEPEAISSKSPSISAKFSYEENYAGGALAIANHLADFISEVTLITTHGSEKHFADLLKEKVDKRIRVFAQELPNIPTPRKTRYIARDKSQRIFEITNLRSDQWQQHSPVEICQLIKKTNSEKGTTILADFGHGFFEGEVLRFASELKGYVALNVQTNSSNLGFNPFTKHKRFSYLSIDTREVRLAYHDRFTPSFELAQKLRRDLKAQASVSMTLGPEGAYFFPERSDSMVIAPVFADSVVDSVGAGDAYFAVTSLLVNAGCPSEMVPFLGNVFAGLKTKIIGNKFSVTRAQFVKAINSILK
jgi:rfaE bifunctional protein nucleotidyltransferase chain/domain